MGKVVGADGAIGGPFPPAIVRAARKWIGTPYRHQAAARGVGCDCLGLLAGVWREVYGREAEPLPPYSRDWGDADGNEHLLAAALRHFDAIDPAHAGPSDVVAFRWARARVAKHCGILTEGSVREGWLVHAYEKRGVVEVPIGAFATRVVAAFKWRSADRIL